METTQHTGEQIEEIFLEEWGVEGPLPSGGNTVSMYVFDSDPGGTPTAWAVVEITRDVLYELRVGAPEEVLESLGIKRG